MIKHLLYAARHYFIFKPLHYLQGCRWYLRDYRQLKQNPNPAFPLKNSKFFPCLDDRTEHTPLDPVYFYQNAWAAGKVFAARPTHHVDIGSQVGFVGIVSQFVPTTMIDLRPIDVVLPGLTFIKGDVLQLPFSNHELESVSSICVLEHIGLGRYGDTVDAWGSEKAITELLRVTKPGGKIIITLPIDSISRIYFNAHRAFTREHILNLFKTCRLLDEAYIYGQRLVKSYNPAQGFGTGLFYFEKQ